MTGCLKSPNHCDPSAAFWSPIIGMIMQTISIPRALIAVRRRSMCLTADLVALHGCQRGVRKQKTCVNANQQAIARAEAALGNAMAHIGGEMVAVGHALVQLGGFIDANLTAQQKADLIGAGRRGVALPDGVPFLKMIQDGLELPAARDGRTLCGPLLLCLAAFCGATLREHSERELQAKSESWIAKRISVNGGIIHAAPSHLQ